MKISLIGATGFVGSAVLAELERPTHVRGRFTVARHGAPSTTPATPARR